MSGFMQTLEEHPLVIGAVAIGVVLLAFLHSSAGSSSSGGGVTVYGSTSQPLDPNVAAIDEAQIAAGTTNISTIASVIGGINTTNAEETTSLASTQANLEASIAQTDAEQEVEDAQTAAGVTINSQNNAANIAAANITATTQQQQIAAAAATAKGAQAVQVQLGQFQKDIARAKDNTDLANSILGFGGKVLAFFGL